MEHKSPTTIPCLLMSPPDSTPRDAFLLSPKSFKQPRLRLPRQTLPMSPPTSPNLRASPHHSPSPPAICDPILFSPIDSQTQQTPLFHQSEAAEQAEQVVDGHVAARQSSMFLAASPPRRSDYHLALEFKSQVARRFNRDRARWLRREREYLLEDRALAHGKRRYPIIAPAPAGRLRYASTARVAKPVVIQPTTVNPTVVVAKPEPEPKLPTPSRRRIAQAVATQTLSALAIDTKKVVREDRDFDDLPDFSPPLSSLDDKPNALKTDWKATPISLAGDAHLSLLHPDEVRLAANLRLDGATYLTSKRRIFIGRLLCLRRGKEFRKTDAQQACKIDVNKASRLWTAFDRVGWLAKSWMEPHLSSTAV